MHYSIPHTKISAHSCVSAVSLICQRNALICYSKVYTKRDLSPDKQYCYLICYTNSYAAQLVYLIRNTVSLIRYCNLYRYRPVCLSS